jgi:hypothetical protein
MSEKRELTLGISCDAGMKPITNLIQGYRGVLDLEIDNDYKNPMFLTIS